MAKNVNHVVVDGKTIVDLREDSVTPETLAAGATAHDASGTAIVGTGKPVVYVEVSGTDDDITGDKTLTEIKAAYEAGNTVVARQNTALYELTYISDTRAEFTRVNETNYYVLSCSNSGAPSEADIWQLNATARLNRGTKYEDIGLKTVLGAINELQNGGGVTADAITDALGYTPRKAWYVTVTQTSSDSAGATADKTPQEIFAAYQAGYAVYAMVVFADLDMVGTVLPLAAGTPNAGCIEFSSTSQWAPITSVESVNARCMEETDGEYVWSVWRTKVVKPDDIVTETTEVLPAYTNQIPLSTDAAGAVLNGVGYESGQLDMNGTVTTGTSFVSGFIPVKKGDVIRVKDPSSANFSTGLVFALYKADKATGTNIGRYINTMQASAAYGAVSISGNVLTWDTSSVGYYFWTDFAYLRVTTNSAASIVTVNEEIAETSQTVMTLKPTVKVGESNLNFTVATPLLNGKKVVVFGDSIIGMTRDQTSVPAYAAAYTGATTYNVGFGGCRMSVHPTNGYAAFSMWALADAVSTGTYTTQDAQASSGSDYFPEQLALLKSIDFSAVDMIVIHYGTNDFAANVAIDNAADDDDTTTLCGALRYSLRKLQTAYPKIRIFVSVPIYRKWGNVGAETYTNSNGKKLWDFCTALAGVAAEFNCPVIDGYKALGINTINDAAFSSDGTHLNDYGRQAFGECIGGNLIAPTAPTLVPNGN